MNSPFNEQKYKSLLKGLKVSEIMLSEILKSKVFRLDSEPFQKIAKEWLNPKCKKLTEIADTNPLKREISHLDKNMLISFIPMESLGFGIINNSEKRKISEFHKTEHTFFAENDILIAKITPSMENGKCAIAKNLTNKCGFGSTEYNVFRVKDKKIFTEFLFVYLNRESIRKEAGSHMVGTSGRQRVPIEFYKNLSIPILELDFQERIKLLVN